MSSQSWVSMMQKIKRLVAVVCSTALIFGAFTTVTFAATGVPRIMNYQGRLMSSGGSLLGGNGTDYCVRFSLYDSSAVGSGTKLWPAGSPSAMTVTVRNGIFNVGVGDTNAGGDTLNFNFEDNDAVYLNVEVATKSGTCGTFENLSPRQRVTAAGYAINSATLNGKNGSYYLANAYSTTSAAFNLATYDKGYFFSTTSVSYWDSAQGRWATTSSDAWLATKTTDNLPQGITNLYYSNTRVSDFVHASSTIAKSYTNNTFTGTNAFQNDVSLQNATTSNFNITNTISGAGLTACAGSSDKLTWDAATRTFGCGADAGAGGGITSIGAQYSVFQSGASQTLATSTDTNIGIEITSTSNTHTFTPKWIGTLAGGRGGTGIGSVSQNGLLIGAAGNTWAQVATSSLGLPTYADLGAYLGLAAWYATTTDALGEGSVHLYFTPNRVAGVLAGTTTDAIAEGSNNKYYTPNRVAGVIAGTTTDALAEGATNKYFTPSNADTYLSGKDKGYFFSTTSAAYFSAQNPGASFSTSSADFWKLQNNFHSTTSFAYNLATYDKGYFFSTTSVNFWESAQNRWATTSSDAWLASKSTSDLQEGSNLYYTPGRVAGVIAGTTTDALAEGSNNKYYTPNRVAGVIAGTTTDALAQGTVNKYYNNSLVLTYLNALGNGFFFSTTSSDFWKTQNSFFSTTSTDFWKTQNNFFSTTSASAFLAQNQGQAFSTTSASHFASLGLAHSTTSVAYQLSQNTTLGNSTSTNSFATTASSTNLFSNIATFGSAVIGAITGNTIIATNATNTTSFATSASSTNLYSNTATVGSATIGSLTTVGTTTGSNGVNISTGCFAVNGTCIQSGSSLLNANNTWTGINTFAGDVSLGNATSTAINTTRLGIGGLNYFTSLTGTGLLNSGGILTLDTSGDWTGTFGGHTGAYYLANSYSTTSAAYHISTIDKGYFFSTTSASQFAAAGLAFSTTSADYYKSQNNFFSTTSAAFNLTTYDKGYFFSTTSVNYWDSTQNRWATTSADAWLATKSTSNLPEGSNLYYTPSRVAGIIAGTTTDALAEGVTNQYFHTSLVNGFIAGSSSIPKTFSSNTFTGTNGFQNITATNATSTTSFATTASSSNLFANTGSVGSATIGSLTTSATTTGNNGFNLNNGCFAISGTCITSGASLLGSNNTWTGVNTFNGNVTLSNATSTGLNTNVFGLGSNYFTSLLGNGLQNSAGVLTVNQGQAFSTTSAAQFAAVGLAHSTTSSAYFLSQNQGQAFSTTSTDFWKTQNNFFSTTSTDFWKTQNNFFSTSSASYFSSLGLAFSTTSTSYFLAQNQGAAFSTTSASQFAAVGLAHSTTSVAYQLSQNTTLGNSTSTNFFATTASSTNLFALNGTTTKMSALFGNITFATFTNATSTTFFATTASSSNLFSNTATVGTVTAGSLSANSATLANATTTALSSTIASTTNQFISGVSNGLLSTGANGSVQATTFSGPLSFNGGILSLSQGGAAANGYISSTDWNSFNSRLSTSTLALVDKGFFFSTTSASVFLAQNQGAAFSTTSADAYIGATSSIPKTYTTNTFIGVNNFANITVAGATTTSLFSSTASSTNIFATAARFGSISGFSLTGAVAAAGNDILGANNASSTNLWISNIRNGLLATNGQGSVIASSTPTAASFVATSNTAASQLPFASSTQISVLQQLSIGAANGTILQGASTGTSSIGGFINVSGTNSTSTFSGGLQASRLNITGGTSTSAGGFNITAGCFAVNGVCVSGAVNSVSATNTTLNVNPVSGNVGISLNLSNPNLWTGLQQFSNATSSLFEAAKFYASSIVSTSTTLVLQSAISSTAGLTFGSTSTPQVAAVDTINNRFTLGTGGASPSLLVLDTKNTAGDPSGVAGSMYYNSNVGAFRCFNTSWVTCGGQAASSTGDVQFRNIDGSFTATSNFNWSQVGNGLTLTGSSTTQTLDLFMVASSSGRTMFAVNGMGVMALSSTSEPVTPPAGEVDIYSQEVANRSMPFWKAPSGISTPFQASLGFSKISFVQAAGAALTATGVTLTNVGTLSAAALSTATLKQSVSRTTNTSAAAAASLSYTRAGALMVTRGNASTIGGFFMTMRFGLTTLQTGNRGFFGLADSVANPTNVDPTTNTTPGKVGMAFNANTGNWKFVQNVTGTAPAVVDLGASFPLNTTDLYELIIFSKPNDTVISYRITNLSTGAQISSTTAATNIPANTTFLAPQSWMTNNATAASVAYDLSGWYLESNN